MLAHLVHHKGKGIWVIILPLFIGLILVQLIQIFVWTEFEKYLAPVTFLLSGVILFWMDNRRKIISNGVLNQTIIKLPREKRKNTLMWIEVRYWAVLLFLIGAVWFFNVNN